MLTPINNTIIANKIIAIVVALFCFFISTASASEWISFNERSESAPIYNLTNSTNSLVEFELEIPGMNSTDVDNFDELVKNNSG